MKKEYEIILYAVLINKSEDENNYLNKLLSLPNINWTLISGLLMVHRLCGYFYKNLNKEQVLLVPKEIREYLKLICNAQYNQQCIRANELSNLFIELEKNNIKYAGLKGVIFCADMYSMYERRSNDLDIFISEADLIKFDSIVRKMNYIQSNSKPGEIIVEATKKEKLIQRMNHHDLVPYVKIIENEFIQIDVNIHFDSKDNMIDEEIFNRGTCIYENENYKFRGLSIESNLLFLCSHMYREATSTIWTKIKRDISLYKIVDIVNFIRSHINEIDIESLVESAKKLSLDRHCYFTFNVINQFYNLSICDAVKNKFSFSNYDFMNQIKVVGTSEIIKRTNSFFDMAFNIYNSGETNDL